MLAPSPLLACQVPRARARATAIIRTGAVTGTRKRAITSTHTRRIKTKIIRTGTGRNKKKSYNKNK